MDLVGANLPRRLKEDNSVTRISLVNDDIYVVQGRNNIAEVFKSANLAVTLPYNIALRSCFGMDKMAASIYMKDASGSRSKPIPGSNILDDDRVGFKTY